MGLLRAKYLRSTAEKNKGKMMMDGWMDMGEIHISKALKDIYST